MAKPKQKAVKTPKKRSTKYGKLAAVCSKELSAKKSALVKAEKSLAKAQQSHSTLLAEVARLDMLDRSLKALINGTEPPQNVRYVYTYPQWVWYGNGWYGNGYPWTVTLGNNTLGNNYGNFQCGQYTIPSVNTINTTIGDAPVITTTAGALMSDASSGTIYTTATSGNMMMCNNANLGNNVSLTSGSAGLSSTSFTTTNGPNGAELTVDLSTGAVDDSLTHEEADEEPADKQALPAGYGG